MKLIRFLMLSSLAVTTLGACSPEKPWMMEQSTLSQNSMRLVESRHIVKRPMLQLTQDDVSDAAHIYGRLGAGPLYVVLAYKDHGKIGEAAVQEKSSAITSQLTRAGIAPQDIIASIVPLETEQPVALIAFDTLEARGPKDCTKMPGYGPVVEEEGVFDYKLGCTVHDVMARQVADPRDLEGHAGLGGTADGEHAANVIATQYKPGEPRDYLPSYVITELAGSGD